MQPSAHKAAALSTLGCSLQQNTLGCSLQHIGLHSTCTTTRPSHRVAASASIMWLQVAGLRAEAAAAAAALRRRHGSAAAADAAAAVAALSLNVGVPRDMQVGEYVSKR